MWGLRYIITVCRGSTAHPQAIRGCVRIDPHGPGTKNGIVPKRRVPCHAEDVSEQFPVETKSAREFLRHAYACHVDAENSNE